VATADSASTVTGQFTVSFAAVLEEKQARSVAARIRVDGQVPRITSSERAGKTLYRVVLGPYSTRAEAERVGRASGQSYWIFEGAP
jgi:cell division protein FtsN